MNKIALILIAAVSVVCFAVAAHAIDLTVFTPYLIQWAMDNPKVASVVIVIGTARLYIKPTVTFVQKIVAATPTKWDDSLIDRLQRKKWFRVLVYVSDWLLSIKVESIKKVQAKAEAEKKAHE